MIQENELRRGNYILYLNELYVVTGMKEESEVRRLRVYFQTLNGELKNAKLLNWITPILLTPEILENCGFKYGKVEGISSFYESEREGDTHYWDLSIKRTDLIDSHEISIVKWGDDELYTFQLGRGTYRQQIKYVHQLQNLIYPLAGVELKVVW